MIISSPSFSPLPYWWFCFPPVGLLVFNTMETLTLIKSSFTLIDLPAYLTRLSEHSSHNLLMPLKVDFSVAWFTDFITCSPAAMAYTFISCHNRAYHRTLTGFAIYCEDSPGPLTKKVRHPSDDSFASGGSPLRLLITQLPLAIWIAIPSPDVDFTSLTLPIE
ncbi:MAG: hypothetical protein LBV23_07150 [Deltaproteobacteria bacterium]|nr:hypothetical protein [Deltaproteobacteria bacterium]